MVAHVLPTLGKGRHSTCLFAVWAVLCSSLGHLCSCTIPGNACFHISRFPKPSRHPQGLLQFVKLAFSFLFPAKRLAEFLPLPGTSRAAATPTHPLSSPRHRRPQSATSGTSAPAVGLVLQAPSRQALLTISTLFHIQMREPQKNVILEGEQRNSPQLCFGLGSSCSAAAGLLHVHTSTGFLPKVASQDGHLM